MPTLSNVRQNCELDIKMLRRQARSLPPPITSLHNPYMFSVDLPRKNIYANQPLPKLPRAVLLLLRRDPRATPTPSASSTKYLSLSVDAKPALEHIALLARAAGSLPCRVRSVASAVSA